MNKIIRISALVLTVLAVPALAHAQTQGCVSSPENPTAILGVIGGAACAWPSLRTWIGKRKK
jgi:XrtJ-associated TM-motif-TM protein